MNGFYDLTDDQLRALLDQARRSAASGAAPLYPIPSIQDAIRQREETRLQAQRANPPPIGPETYGRFRGIPNLSDPEGMANLLAARNSSGSMPTGPIEEPPAVAGPNPYEVTMTLGNLPIPPDFIPAPSGPTRQPAGGGRNRGAPAAPPQARQPDPSEVDAAMPAGDPRATMNAGMSERDRNKWMAVLAAGLGMLGGDSPNAAVNIGRGGLAGVQAFQNWEKDRQQGEDRSRALDIQEAYRRDQGEYMRTMGSARERQLEQQMQLAQMRLAQAGTAQERSALANEIRMLEHQRRVAADENNLELRRRTLEDAANRNDPVLRAGAAWDQRRTALLQSLLREAGDVTSPLARLTPEQLAARADQLAGPRPVPVPGPMRQQLREAYAAFDRGDLPPDEWNRMSRDFKSRFNVDPELYLR